LYFSESDISQYFSESDISQYFSESDGYDLCQYAKECDISLNSICK